MVPATTLLLSAFHLMRRDMPFRSVSRQWVRASRIVAVMAGLNMLVGSLVWPRLWVSPISESLCALWPTVFASSLLIHARFVTYVTNEASRESLQPRQPSRWEVRVKAFARHVALMANEEWQIQRAKRAAAKATRTGSKETTSNTIAEQRPAVKTSVASKRRSSAIGKSTEPLVEESPVTKAVNLRPINQPSRDQAAADSSVLQPLHVHPPQPIPPPHFEITESAVSQR